MFTVSYFCNSYFPVMYFCKVGADNPNPSSPSFRVGGGGNYDPYYWDRIRRKREEEEIVVIMN